MNETEFDHYLNSINRLNIVTVEQYEGLAKTAFELHSVEKTLHSSRTELDKDAHIDSLPIRLKKLLRKIFRLKK